MQGFQGFIYGVVFGIVNVIPGISGATMMVIMGCYDKVCGALALDFKHIKENLRFLIPFGVGVIAGIVGAAVVLSGLFELYPVPTYFLFIGLILGSLPFVYRTATKYEKFKKSSIIPIVLATALVVGLSVFGDLSDESSDIRWSRDGTGTFTTTYKNNTNQDISEFHLRFKEGEIVSVVGAQLYYVENTFETIFGGVSDEAQNNAIRPLGADRLGAGESFTFRYVSAAGNPVEFQPKVKYNMSVMFFMVLLFGGMLSAAAMVMPGISGSFMMVLLGIYTTVISAVKNMDIVVLLPAGLGVLIGLVAGAKLIKWLLKRFYTVSYSVIIGLVIGSAYAILPLDEIEVGPQLIFGIGIMVVAGAISLSIGAERNAKDEMVKIARNLEE
ncbi:MAG: DUF368 domain-containing protein [Oscillospiraceae bacterium]|nr:DUF368 domain-containing protein [Oscillospiraceae bacterium]